MRLRIASWLLVGVFMLSIYFRVGVVVFYNLFQKQIAEAACINKLRDSKCQGKCYLKKQTEGQSSNTTPFSFTKIEIGYFLIPELPALNNYLTSETNLPQLWHYVDKLCDGIIIPNEKPPKTSKTPLSFS